VANHDRNTLRESPPQLFMPRRCRLTFAPLLLLFVVSVGAAQDSAGNSGITYQQAEDILKELKEIRQLLESSMKTAKPQSAAVAPLTGKMSREGGYSLGSNDAPLVIVEFTDYQCPYCRQFHSTTFGEIRRKYVDPGKVRLVIHDLPLVDIHPDAMRAAQAARCAGDQSQFLAMHDLLFGDPANLGQDGLMNYARSLKLDTAAFQSCLGSSRHKAEIERDIAVASSLQISATPSFLVGRMKGEEIVGIIVVGAQQLSFFEAKLLDAQAAEP
jgi:protein-disulfide isomerase